MVLVHKLRQSEHVDFANMYGQDEPKPLQISPTRPQTRSQSNGDRVGVKRHRLLNDDEPTVIKKPRRQPQQTRTRKPKSASSEDDADADADADPDDDEYVGPIPSPQVKLVQVDPSVQPDPPTHRPGPRTRVQPPIPVPNLTKKSRGRRVPTANSTGDDDVRRYVCSVESCGKCFYRGEHLKRHVRSIHTNEKPFDCPHPKCNKTFNRHDNLLQHVKIHGQRAIAAANASKRKATATSSASSLASTTSMVTVSDAPAPSPPPAIARTDTLVDLDAASNEDTHPSPSITALHEQVQQQHYMMMMAAAAAAAASTSPYTLEPPTPAYVANNMAAVSSLRTEIAGGSTAGSEGGDVEALDHSLVGLSRGDDGLVI